MLPESLKSLLEDRAHCLAVARDFFAGRGILEVDTPLLSTTAPIDLHIDVLRVALPDERWGYLHTSPEYAMKRLIAAGMGDIYQLGHVFREGECGDYHNPEFTMAEWYRLGIEYDRFIEEVVDFMRCFLGDLPAEKIHYRSAFHLYADIDPYIATERELLACAHAHGVSTPPSARDWARSVLLQLLLSSVIEKKFSQQHITILCDYPPWEASLARTHSVDGVTVAKRFEIYYGSLELANGYHELTDPEEQLRRFKATNQMRSREGKSPLPIDYAFIKALENLPDCCGVAVGFDRLMLLRQQRDSLSSILPFAWTTLSTSVQ
jgi:lysyl-tRNA synthetase class 2